MLPTFTINYLAVVACAVVAMPVGFLWFGPIFGQAWQRHMGFGNMQPGESGPMGKAMAIFFASNLLMAWVLAHSIKAWQACRGGFRPTRRRGCTPSTPASSTGWGSFFRCR
jgi:hypothetical protein